MQLATVAMLATLTNAVAKVPTDFVVPHFVEVMSVSARLARAIIVMYRLNDAVHDACMCLLLWQPTWPERVPRAGVFMPERGNQVHLNVQEQEV